MPSSRPSVDLDRTLRARYEDLLNIRETKPEREAAASRQALERHMTATEALVASLHADLERARAAPLPAPDAADAAALRDDNAALREECAALRRRLEQQPLAAPAAAAAPAAERSAAQAAAATSALEQQVAFYTMMTGMGVELVGEVATCAVAARAITGAPAARREQRGRLLRHEPPCRRAKQGSRSRVAKERAPALPRLRLVVRSAGAAPAVAARHATRRRWRRDASLRSRTAHSLAAV